MIQKKYLFLLRNSANLCSQFSTNYFARFSINATLNGSLNKQQDAEVKEESKRAVKLYASVCVERMPVITCDMNDLEKRYSNLINEINIRRSYLSNHELRHLKDLELAKKKKKDEDSENMVIETALDYEEKCLNQLKAMKFSERKLGVEYDKKLIGMNQSTDKRNIAELQNVDYILDKKLILLVNEENTSNWGLPKGEWSITDTSLRQTAERIIKSLNDKLEVEFLGNAPFAVYKTKRDENTIEKCYFFKAQYKKGAQFLASSNSSSDFVWIRKNELKDFIDDKKYLECLSNFILDF